MQDLYHQPYIQMVAHQGFQPLQAIREEISSQLTWCCSFEPHVCTDFLAFTDQIPGSVGSSLRSLEKMGDLLDRGFIQS